MIRINVPLPDGLHRRIKILSAKRGVSLREWVRDALASEADRQEAEDRKRRR